MKYNSILLNTIMKELFLKKIMEYFLFYIDINISKNLEKKYAIKIIK